MGAVEGLHVVECRPGDVVGREPDGRPAVGVDFVGQRPQQHRLVAVGLVEVALAELLDHHAFLRLEFSGGDVQPLHAVAFEPQCGLDIVLGEGDVEIRIVVVGEGVVVAAGHLHGQVEIRNFARAAEHQVFEQVGETRARGFSLRAPTLYNMFTAASFEALSRLTTIVRPLASVLFLYSIMDAKI